MTEALRDINIHEPKAEWAYIKTLLDQNAELKNRWGKFKVLFERNLNLFPVDKFHHEKRIHPNELSHTSWDVLFEEWLLLTAHAMVEKTLEKFSFPYKELEDNLASIKANQPNAPLRYAQLLIFHAKRGEEIHRDELQAALWRFIRQIFAAEEDSLPLLNHATNETSRAIEAMCLDKIPDALPFEPNPQGATTTDSKKLGVIFKMMAVIALIIKLFSGIVEKWPDHINPFADRFKYPSKPEKK